MSFTDALNRLFDACKHGPHETGRTCIVSADDLAAMLEDHRRMANELHDSDREAWRALRELTSDLAPMHAIALVRPDSVDDRDGFIVAHVDEEGLDTVLASGDTLSGAVMAAYEEIPNRHVERRGDAELY